ncbi:serine hydrolase family protein [Mesorhizobium sp. M00.F.Ca.ET.216.01.1.1]|nr:serine hydrolase family protein [Mesorhizobium sp. M00.F.Ca.ET.216.01.1.1]
MATDRRESSDEEKIVRRFVILPGIGGSGERHWQTLWERCDPAMRRFRPASWNAPVLGQWIVALDEAVGEAGPSCILVAHSLACLLVANWSARSSLAAAGAFLVSVPNPQSAAFPTSAAASFTTVPAAPLRFPTRIVASGNDPFGSVIYQRRCAEQWGSRFIELSALGHINAASGLGDWPEGLHLLREFAEEIQRVGAVPPAKGERLA